MKILIMATVFSVLFFTSPVNADIVLESFEEIETAHKILNYKWKTKAVPRIVINSIPEEIKDMTAIKRVRFFVKIMMPLILLENEKIMEERNRFLALQEKEHLSDEEIRFLNETAVKYRIISSETDISESDESHLQHVFNMADYKIMAIPPAIALAMAALESGWGTSRFVSEGNNLFGHVARNPEDGLQPANWAGMSRNIMIFDSLQESVSTYMLNLNRNRAYNKFRVTRKHRPYDIIGMTEGFYLYAIIGDEYAGRLQFIISRYRFAELNDAYLDCEKRTASLKALKQAYIQ